jgi:ubiquitin-like-conjugating enzyme ATG3
MYNMFTSAPTTSHFLDKGVLTPEEFLEAGDQLVFKFPTWQWASASKDRCVSYLPEDKQYLLTRNVPCTARVKDLETSVSNSKLDGEGDWLVAGVEQERPGGDAGILRIDEPEGAQTDAPPMFAVKEDFIGGSGGHGAKIPDITGLNFEDVVEDDPAAAPTGGGYFVTEAPEAEIVRTRTYDLSISYDKYYQTPRLWLFGYDENGVPLVPEQIYQDVMSEYVSRTVTVDTHPHTSLPTTSIHPCKHAQVMKKVIDDWVEQGLQPRHDLALFVFLKFISGVVPTINYDFTMDIEL